MQGPDATGLPSVAILVLNWNGWPDTLECLESVLRLDYPGSQVIVCDNGSTDASRQRIRDWAAGRLDVVPRRGEMAAYGRPPVAKPIPVRSLSRDEAERGGDDRPDPATLVLISNGANLGFAAGNNVGLRYALARGYDLVWLLNADTVVTPAALRALVDRMGSDPGIGMCGSMLCYYDAPGIIEEAGGCAYYPLLGMARRLMKDRPIDRGTDWSRIERRLGYVSGASCLVRSDFLRAVGLMGEDYFLYGEEIDWACRAKGRYRLALAPESIVFHKKGRSTGSKSYRAGRSARSAYFLWRARTRVTRRYHPLGLPAVFLLGLLAAAREHARGDRGAARAVCLGTLDREFR